MSTLHLVRHAEAARSTAGGPDHDRALTPRGRTDAGRLGAHMRRAGVVPDLVLCSTARRARETLEQLGLPATQTSLEGRLYEASADNLLERLHGVPNGVRTICLIGHNPAVHQLALDLAGAGDALRQLTEAFPAGSVASLGAPVDRWADLAPGGAELTGFVVPAELE